MLIGIICSSGRPVMVSIEIDVFFLMAVKYTVQIRNDDAAKVLSDQLQPGLLVMVSGAVFFVSIEC